ncbi:MAG: type III-B CRISPR module-associated protein Cmr5 [Calditerrivibrio sp.]|nr:type III-B CRISPR module-associated protein Cmr5 [Calditerrivibrio sp.]MCA1980400.1 type III-B CRISPR module-associated protein Cmr5 [Calditerrivibrio sp.]
MKTMGQKRAHYALNKIINLIQDNGNKDLRKDFKSLVNSAPSIILKNGFGQALAFWYSKGTDKDLKIKENDKHIILLRLIMNWLNERKFTHAKDEKAFLKELFDMDQSKYLASQSEVLKFLEWVKRFANTDIGGN